MKIAVVGTGISGLGAARALAGYGQVTVFEAESRLGGHTHTVDVAVGGQRIAVDTGFLVFNERTYPHLIQMLEELGIDSVSTDMSFSVKLPGLEWCGTDLNGVFAQRGNLLQPRFWRMLSEILRFNREATALIRANTDPVLDQPLADYLRQGGYSELFIHGYLLPMAGAIWSCPTSQMQAFPLRSLLRFCDNHGLLQVNHRPRWFTVPGGARRYVDAIRRELRRAGVRVLPNTPVLSVGLDHGQGCLIRSTQGEERFDAVVLACHSDQSAALLPPNAPQQNIVRAVAYQPNRAVLHTDCSVLPNRERAWAAWNYQSQSATADQESRVCVHYLLNRLQPLSTNTPVILSLNPITPIDPATVLREIDYAHPVFDQTAIAAQARLPSVQGVGGIWLAGAWTGYGFHEDGLRSGLTVAESLQARITAAQSRAA